MKLATMKIVCLLALVSGVFMVGLVLDISYAQIAYERALESWPRQESGDLNLRVPGAVLGVLFIVLGLYGLLPKIPVSRSGAITYKGANGDIVLQLAPIRKVLLKMMRRMPEVYSIDLNLRPDSDERRARIDADVVLKNCAAQGARQCAKIVAACLTTTAQGLLGLEDLSAVRINIKGVHVDIGAAGKQVREQLQMQQAEEAAACALARTSVADAATKSDDVEAPEQTEETATPEQDTESDAQAGEMPEPLDDYERDAQEPEQPGAVASDEPDEQAIEMSDAVEADELQAQEVEALEATEDGVLDAQEPETLEPLGEDGTQAQAAAMAASVRDDASPLEVAAPEEDSLSVTEEEDEDEYAPDVEAVDTPEPVEAEEEYPEVQDDAAASHVEDADMSALTDSDEDNYAAPEGVTLPPLMGEQGMPSEARDNYEGETADDDADEASVDAVEPAEILEEPDWKSKDAPEPMAEESEDAYQESEDDDEGDDTPIV